MVSFGFEVLYVLAVTALTGVAVVMHLIGANYNFPFFGNSAKFLSSINLVFLAVFWILTNLLRYDDFFALWTFFFALANIKVLKQYLKK